MIFEFNLMKKEFNSCFHTPTYVKINIMKKICNGVCVLIESVLIIIIYTKMNNVLFMVLSRQFFLEKIMLNSFLGYKNKG